MSATKKSIQQKKKHYIVSMMVQDSKISAEAMELARNVYCIDNKDYVGYLALEVNDTYAGISQQAQFLNIHQYMQLNNFRFAQYRNNNKSLNYAINHNLKIIIITKSHNTAYDFDFGFHRNHALMASFILAHEQQLPNDNCYILTRDWDIDIKSDPEGLRLNMIPLTHITSYNAQDQSTHNKYLTNPIVACHNIITNIPQTVHMLKGCYAFADTTDKELNIHATSALLNAMLRMNNRNSYPSETAQMYKLDFLRIMLSDLYLDCVNNNSLRNNKIINTIVTNLTEHIPQDFKDQHKQLIVHKLKILLQQNNHNDIMSMCNFFVHAKNEGKFTEALIRAYAKEFHPKDNINIEHNMYCQLTASGAHVTISIKEQKSFNTISHEIKNFYYQRDESMFKQMDNQISTTAARNFFLQHHAALTNIFHTSKTTRKTYKQINMDFHYDNSCRSIARESDFYVMQIRQSACFFNPWNIK